MEILVKQIKEADLRTERYVIADLTTKTDLETLAHNEEALQAGRVKAREFYKAQTPDHEIVILEVRIVYEAL